MTTVFIPVNKQAQRIAELEAELKFMTAERDYLLETPDPKAAKLKEAIQAHKRSFTINGSGTKEDMELWAALEEGEQ